MQGQQIVAVLLFLVALALGLITNLLSSDPSVQNWFTRNRSLVYALGVVCVLAGIFLTISAQTSEPSGNNSNRQNNTLTPVPNQAIVVPSGWREILSERFTGNQHGWDEANRFSNPETRAATEDYGIVKTSVTNDGWYNVEVVPDTSAGFTGGGGSPSISTVDSDFFISVEAAKTEGREDTSCGIIFGAANYANHFLFRVQSDQQLFAVKHVSNGDRWEPLTGKDDKFSPIIQADGVNRLNILAENGLFKFFINNELVWERHLNSYNGGKIDVAAQVITPTTGVCKFDNFELYAP